MGLFNKGKQKEVQDNTNVSLFDDDSLGGFDGSMSDEYIGESTEDYETADVQDSETIELEEQVSDEDGFEDTEGSNDNYGEDDDSDEYGSNRIIESDPNSYVLYMIIDKPIDGMLHYFRSYGLNVSRIFSSIKEARDVVLMQVIKSKLIVIDTGTGRFTSMASRNELTDLLGIGDDDNSTIVFYSDSVIKTEVEYSRELENKRVDWVKYKSTAQVLAYLLKNKGKEEYVPDGEYTQAAKIVEDLSHKGFKLSDEALDMVNMGEVQINTSDIISKQTGENSDYSEIPGYTVEL